MGSIDDPRVRRGMEAQLAGWRRAIAGGATRVGWKLGINARAVQRVLGIDGVVLGNLTSATLVAPGGVHSLARGTRVGMEAEVALHLGADLRGGPVPPTCAGRSRASAPPSSWSTSTGPSTTSRRSWRATSSTGP